MLCSHTFMTTANRDDESGFQLAQHMLLAPTLALVVHSEAKPEQPVTTPHSALAG